MQNRTLLALMAEYRRAVADYCTVIERLSIADFEQLRDPNTPDPECKTIQGVCFHVIQSGYTYANYIRTIGNRSWLGYKTVPIDAPATITALAAMLDYTDEALAPVATQTDNELALYRFDTRWHVSYDLEQLLEHAIVHILRHRRQIENFL